MHEPKLYAAEGPVTGHEGKYTCAFVGCTCGWNSDGKSYNKEGDWYAHLGAASGAQLFDAEKVAMEIVEQYDAEVRRRISTQEWPPCAPDRVLPAVFVPFSILEEIIHVHLESMAEPGAASGAQLDEEQIQIRIRNVLAVIYGGAPMDNLTPEVQALVRHWQKAAPAVKELSGYDLAGCADRAKLAVRVRTQLEDLLPLAGDWDRFAAEVNALLRSGGKP